MKVSDAKYTEMAKNIFLKLLHSAHFCKQRKILTFKRNDLTFHGSSTLLCVSMLSMMCITDFPGVQD